MAILETLLQMQQQRNAAPQEAATRLAETLGGIVAQRGQADFRKKATEYFAKNEVSPDSIRQFQEYYPNVDPQEVFKVAGVVAQQKKAQRVRDLGSTIMRIASENGGEIPQDKFKEIAMGVDGSLLPEVMTAMQAFKKVNPEVKWEKLGAGEKAFKTIGGKMVPGETMEGPEKPPERAYKVGQIIEKSEGDKKFSGQVTGYDDKNLPIVDRWVEVKAAAKPFEVNVASEIDTVLGSMFPGYYTDPEIRKTALNYYATPKGGEYVQKKAAEYNRSKAPAIYNVTPTSEGLVPVNVRTGQVGSPATNPSTGKAYGKPTPASEMKAGEYLDVMGNAVSRIEQNYKPNYVGPVAGRLGQVKEMVVDLPESQVTFYADVNDIKDQLLRARSGAQINEQEYQRLVRFLPDATNPSENFKTKLSRFKQELTDMQNARAKQLETGGYRQAVKSTVGKSREDIMGPLRRANPGTSDAELEAYAKKKGYL